MKTPFKPLDLVERIEPNPDGTHDVEMVDVTSKSVVFPNQQAMLFVGEDSNKAKYSSHYRLLSPQEVLINLE